MLEMLHLSGEGVLQCSTKAREFLLKAAADGDGLSQAKLGQIYYEGLGVKPTPNEAFIRFEKAAQKQFSSEIVDGVRMASAIALHKNITPTYLAYKMTGGMTQMPPEKVNVLNIVIFPSANIDTELFPPRT